MLNRLAVASLAAFAFAACSDGGPTEPLADSQTALGPTPQAALTVIGDAGSVPLIAGQTMEVGTVTVSRSGDDLIVFFEITDSDWCITETHVAVEKDLSDIPQTRSGNPKIGNFEFSEDDLGCLSSKEVVVADRPAADGPFLIAAHAVVERCEFVEGEGEGQQILFGIFDGDGNGDGDLYAVDPATGDANLIFDGADPSGDIFSPNALAFDEVRERLYFTVDEDGDRNSADNELYYFDLDAAAPVLVAGGPLDETPVYNASWYSGEYYFIPNNTDDLFKVTFNGDGTAIAGQSSVCSGLVPEATSGLQFGDIAIEPANGVLYGWGRDGEVGDYFFFTIDVDDCSGASSVNVTDDFGTTFNLQLALGEDGTLWGHQALSALGGDAGRWYRVTKATGAISVDFATSPSFTDISAGFFEGGEEVCEDETAWGDGANGARFTTQGNWATYFEFTG